MLGKISGQNCESRDSITTAPKTSFYQDDDQNDVKINENVAA
jgi:hypothetical protein